MATHAAKITEEQALALLKKYKVPENIVKHSKAVAKNALEIADSKHIKVDKEKLLIAALLHDIGRAKVMYDGPNPEFGSNRHEKFSVEILKSEGLSEIANIVGKHGYNLFDQKVDKLTKEEKILIIADFTTQDTGKATLEDRGKHVVRKYESTGDYETAERFRKIYEKADQIMKGMGLQ